MTTDFSPRGAYRDRMITGEYHVVDLGWRSNLIVDTCRSLIACFMRGEGPGGIEWLFVGRGMSEWDIAPAGAAPRSTQALSDPSPFEIPVGPSDIEYLDASGNPSAEPTNRIQLVVTLGENEPPDEDPYPLREFGLFGSFGGEPYMINYVRHGVIHKPAEATLERTIRLVF